jgi:hypothetical protein
VVVGIQGVLVIVPVGWMMAGSVEVTSPSNSEAVNVAWSGSWGVHERSEIRIPRKIEQEKRVATIFRIGNIDLEK